MKIKNLQNFIFLILGLIIIVLLAYTFYKSEIVFNGTLRNKYNFYYLFLILAFLFLIFFYFLRQDIKNKIFLFIFSILFSFYIIETFLLFTNEIKLISISKSLNNNLNINNKFIDKRSRLEFYEDRKKTNNKVVLSITPNLLISENKLEFYPLSGISNRETIMCNENGYYSIYNSDRYGFNNPDYEWNSNYVEYLFIGDSYTHGACVNPGENISDHLRKISNKSVLNLGMAGSGTLIEYAALREYAENKNIKNLILIFSPNDIEDIESEKNNFFLKKYFEDLNFTQDLKSKQKKIDNYLINFVESKYKIIHSNKFEFIKLSKTRDFIKKSLASNQRSKLDKDIDYKMFVKILKKIKNYSNKNNINLSMVYLPDFKLDLSQKNKIQDIAERLNINFIDVHIEIFQKYKNKIDLYSYYIPHHLNSVGYKLVAELIYKKTK